MSYKYIIPSLLTWLRSELAGWLAIASYRHIVRYTDLEAVGGGPSSAINAVNGCLRHLTRFQERVVHVALPPRPLGGLAHFALTKTTKGLWVVGIYNTRYTVS